MSDAPSLREIVRGMPKKYVDLLTSDDLQAVVDDNIDGLSSDGLATLARGRQDLGFGEYLDTGTSILGSIAGGAAAGALAGPVGAVVGGIAGGAAGAFGGELIEDVIAHRNIDLMGALKEGGVSALIDTALLGTGKLVRPLLKARGAPMPTADEMRRAIVGAEPGSRASEMSTQQMLTSGGGTLTRGQATELSLLGRIGESVARAGVGSGEYMTRSALKNAEILSNNLKSVIKDGIASMEDVGMFVFKAQEEGVKAARKLYGDATQKVIDELNATGNGLMSTTRIKMGIDNFTKGFRKEWLDTISPDVKKSAAKLRSKLDPELEDYVSQGIPEPIAKIMVNKFGVKGSTGTLVDFYRSVNQLINGDMPSQMNLSDATIKGLTELSNVVKREIREEMKSRSPRALSNFDQANEAYSKSMSALVPEAVPGFIRKGKKQDWHALGKTLLRSRNPSQVKQLFRTIDESYSLVKKSNDSMPTFAPQTASEAKTLIRNSFLQETFGQFLADPGAINKALSGARASLNNEEVLKAVSGDSYPDVKRIVNAIVDSSKISKSALQSGALSIRSGEISTLQTLGAALAGGGAIAAGSTVGGLFGAAAIFGIPAVLARVATNKKAVNRLIFENSRIMRKQKDGGVVNVEDVASSISKVMQNFSDSELAILEDEISRYGPE